MRRLGSIVKAKSLKTLPKVHKDSIAPGLDGTTMRARAFFVATLSFCASAETRVSTFAELEAAIGDGAHIKIDAGITFQRTLVIPGGAAVTIESPYPVRRSLDAANAIQHFHVDGALTLHGVTLTNGFADADSCGDSHQHGLNHECRGGSIYAGLGASLSLVDVEIFRSRARHGGAVYAAHATVDVVRSVFEENRASEEGGAFYVLDAVSGDDDGAAAATTFAATESTFLYNVAPESGALFVAGTATLTDVVFRDNEATEGRGGALRVDDGFASLLRCDFRANGALTEGGGIWVEDKAKIYVSSTTFASNSPDDVHADRSGANEGDVECLAACPSPSHGTCAAAGICFSCACAAPHVVDESASSSKKSSKLPVGEAVAKVEVLIIIHVLAVVLVAAAVACYRRRRAKDHDALGDVELEGVAPRRAEPAPRAPRDDAEAPPDAATPLQDAAGVQGAVSPLHAEAAEPKADTPGLRAVAHTRAA